jgi:hypothetical protein
VVEDSIKNGKTIADLEGKDLKQFIADELTLKKVLYLLTYILSRKVLNLPPKKINQNISLELM